VPRDKSLAGVVTNFTPRPKRGPRKNPVVAALRRAEWADPEKRAKRLAAAAKTRSERELPPHVYTRQGTPSGMTKAQAWDMWFEAKRLANRFIDIMEEEGVLPEIVIPGSDEEMGKEALREAFKLAVGPSQATVKTSNIRTVLEWTKQKPATKTDLNLSNAEAWLAAVQADMKQSKADPFAKIEDTDDEGDGATS
jgi:hypothetical protein